MPGTENTNDQSRDSVDAASQNEYQNLRADLTRYGTDASQLSDEFLASYEENLPDEYARLQALLKERADGQQNNAVISQAVQDMNQFLENEQYATAEEEAAGELDKAKLEKYKPYLESIVASDEWGPKGTRAEVTILSDGRAQIDVVSSLSGTRLVLTSERPFVTNRLNRWAIQGLDSSYETIAQARDDVFTLQTLLYRAKNANPTKENPFYTSKVGPSFALLVDLGAQPTEGNLLEFGEIEAGKPEAFKDFANQKYQEMMGITPSKEGGEFLEANLKYLREAKGNIFASAMDHLNGLGMDATQEDYFRNALDQYHAAFNAGERANDAKAMRSALDRFEYEDKMMQVFVPAMRSLNAIQDSSLQGRFRAHLDAVHVEFQEALKAGDIRGMDAHLRAFTAIANQIPTEVQKQPLPKAPERGQTAAPAKAPAAVGPASPERAPESSSRAAWLNRLKANPDAYLTKKAGANGVGGAGTEVLVHLKPEDVRPSRIQDLIGPEGQSVIGFKTEELPNMAVIANGVEHRWNAANGTWEDPTGERFRVFDGTKFTYKNLPLAIPEDKAAPSKAIITLNQAMIDSKITVAHGRYEYTDDKGVTVVQDGPFKDGKLEGHGKETRTIGGLVTVTEGTFKDGLLIKGIKTTTEGATTRTIEVGGDANQVDASVFDDAVKAMDEEV